MSKRGTVSSRSSKDKVSRNADMTIKESKAEMHG